MGYLLTTHPVISLTSAQPVFGLISQLILVISILEARTGRKETPRNEKSLLVHLAGFRPVKNYKVVHKFEIKQSMHIKKPLLLIQIKIKRKLLLQPQVLTQ